jgi:type I restriction enzyme, S subunit
MSLRTKSKLLPKGWVEKRLGDIATFRNGLNFTKNSHGESIKIVGVRDFQDNFWIQEEQLESVTIDGELKEIDVLRKGDILTVRSNGNKELIGRCVLVGNLSEKTSHSGFTIRIRIEREDIYLPFLVHFLKSKDLRKQLTESGGGINISSLNQQGLSSITIRFPSLVEQKTIVDNLNEVFEGIDRAIANTERNIASDREIFESYLNTVFTQKGDGWVEKTLREVSSDFGRGKSKHRPRNDPKLYGGSYPFIQTGDVRNSNHVITESSQSYNEVGLAQSKLWRKGTICITIAANIAETGILGFDACFPDSLIGIVVNEELTSNDFVEYLLQAVKARIKAKGKGSAQDNINLATFENERFPFPSLEQQKVIVDKLNELSSETQRLEAIHQQKLAALKELKQSILQKAFTGELTADTATQAAKATKEIAA